MLTVIWNVGIFSNLFAVAMHQEYVLWALRKQKLPGDHTSSHSFRVEPSGRKTIEPNFLLLFWRFTEECFHFPHEQYYGSSWVRVPHTVVLWSHWAKQVTHMVLVDPGCSSISWGPENHMYWCLSSTPSVLINWRRLGLVISVL